MSNINIIVAASKNLVIGKDNDLPWHIPNDLKYFKKVTAGCTVIMGRKCWESIPEKFRPLPNRRNIVLTRNKDYVAEGAEVVHGLHKALEISSDEDEVFIIGGSQIYKDSFEHADKVYITQIDKIIEGDVKLEGFNRLDWVMDEATEWMTQNSFIYRFETYSKI